MLDTTLQAALAERYAIERELGRGGMAVVYLARDIRHERPVALKVLRPELAASLGPERFLREIKLAAALQHPHILPVHDSGETAGRLWFTMPYVEGQSLRERLTRERQLPLDVALEITCDIAAALEYAQRRGIVHRDVKPENILLQDGEALLADFGVARAIDAAGGDRLTDTGLSLGTPAYMSPEQAAGERTLDGRTDIYSLGCVLYEMLAGEPPFTGPTAQAVIAKRLSEPVPHLSTMRQVPAEVERAVTRALARAPADRFASAAELADALSGGGGPVSSIPSAGAGRRRLLRALGVAVAVLAPSVAGYLLIGRDRAVPSAPAEGIRRLVVLPFENLGRPEDEYFADGMTEEITTRLAGARGLSVIARHSASEYKGSRKPVQQIARDLGVQYVLLGSVRWEKVPGGSSRIRVNPELIQVSDNTALWAGQFDKVLSGVFDVQAQVAEEVARSLGAALLQPERPRGAAPPTRNLAAYDYYLRGKTYLNRGRGPAELDSAQQMLQRATELDPRFALAYAWLSYTHAWQYRLYIDRSPALLAKAKAAVDRALEIDPELPEGHLALGYYHYDSALDYDRALAEFARAQEGRPDDAELLFAIGNVERRQGRWDRALDHMVQAERLDPRNVELPHQLGNTYLLLHQYQEAGRAFDRAILLSPSNVHYYADKAALQLSSTGNLDSVRLILQSIPSSADLSALAAPTWPSMVERRVFAPLLTHEQQSKLRALRSDSATPNAAALLLWKAAVARANREIAAERAYADSSLRFARRLLRERPDDWVLHGQLALAHLVLGKSEDALREAERAAAELPLSKDAFFSTYFLWNLAEVEAATGRHAPAIEHLETLLSRPCWLSVNWLRVDPVWDPLRNEAGFAKLLRQP